MTFDRLSMVHIAAVLSWAMAEGCYDLTPVPASDSGSCPADMTTAYGCASQGDQDAGEADTPANPDASDEPSE
jgi:hypothetical protein